MQVNRTWAIVGEFTNDDIEWLSRSKLRYVLPTMSTLSNFSPYSFKRMTQWEPLEIVTTGPKQEMWLKLYFADRAIITKEEIVYEYDFNNKRRRNHI
jgi:hypothetical protein